MSELLRPWHAAGPILSGFPQHNFNIPFNQVTSGPGVGGSSFAEMSLTRADQLPLTGSMSVPGSGVQIPTLAGVTGSTSSQSVNLATTSLITENGYWIVDGGTAAQEAVLTGPGDIVDATHVNWVLQNNHSANAPCQKVFSCYTKYLNTNLLSVPSTGLANFNFIRYSSLPPNVFDQYLVFGTFGGSAVYSADDVVPWVNGTIYSPSVSAVPLAVPQFSSGSVSSTGNPTNAIVIRTASFTGTASGLNIQVQLLFTSQPEPATNGLFYRYWWDDL